MPCTQSCRVTELDRCGQAALKCWHKMLPNGNMQRGTSSSTVRIVMAQGKSTAALSLSLSLTLSVSLPLSNYTSVRAVVNEGERCTGIALMGKALMRILWTPNAPSSEYFSRRHILRETSPVLNNVKEGCFQIFLKACMHAIHKVPSAPWQARQWMR